MRVLVATSTHPPFAALPATRPQRWLGMTLEWESTAIPTTVLLAFLPGEAAAERLCLLGRRYALAEARCDGDTSSSGSFVEFFVVEERNGIIGHTQRLLQQTNVTFVDEFGEEEEDAVVATSVKNASSLWLASPPSWKVSGAMWPTYNGLPMRFIGQVALDESDVARSHFSWGFDVFLFDAWRANRRIYKIVQQQRDLQTAEEHYRDEQIRERRLARGRRRPGG